MFIIMSKTSINCQFQVTILYFETYYIVLGLTIKDLKRSYIGPLNVFAFFLSRRVGEIYNDLFVFYQKMRLPTNSTCNILTKTSQY